MIEITLLPFVDLNDEGKFNGNFYLGMFYYDPIMTKSIEPFGIVYESGKEETITKIFFRDGTFKLVKIAPLDFYKYIARVHGQINLSFINECKKVDNYTVKELTSNMTLRSE